MCKECRCAARWLSRRTRTRDVVTPFISLPACPSLSTRVRMWVGGQGRRAFLSHCFPLRGLPARPRFRRDSQKGSHTSHPGNTRVRGPSRELRPRAPPLPTPPQPTRPRSLCAGAAPQPRRAPRPASQRNATRPPPLIGGDRGRGGFRQRAADSRWRRPGGGSQPSRRKKRECSEGGLRPTSSAPGRGWWRALEPALKESTPGQREESALPFTFALPASTFLRRCSCSSSSISL